MATIGEKKGTENTEPVALGLLLMILIFIVIGSGLFVSFIDKRINKPSYLVGELIYTVDRLETNLKGRVLIMEKGGDSDNYKQAGEIKTELELVHNKLSEIKIKLKDKPWAN